jgi:hypothetical protein
MTLQLVASCRLKDQQTVLYIVYVFYYKKRLPSSLCIGRNGSVFVGSFAHGNVMGNPLWRYGLPTVLFTCLWMMFYIHDSMVTKSYMRLYRYQTTLCEHMQTTSLSDTRASKRSRHKSTYIQEFRTQVVVLI